MEYNFNNYIIVYKSIHKLVLIQVSIIYIIALSILNFNLLIHNNPLFIIFVIVSSFYLSLTNLNIMNILF